MTFHIAMKLLAKFQKTVPVKFHVSQPVVFKRIIATGERSVDHFCLKMPMFFSEEKPMSWPSVFLYTYSTSLNKALMDSRLCFQC